MTITTQRRAFRPTGESARPRPDASGARGRWLNPGSSSLYVPAGWPEAVLPPYAEGWEDSATAFLLDCCPADYRGYAVLRRHPVVLARFAAEFVGSQVRACREGLGQARASLGAVVHPEVIEAATQAWLEQEAVLLRRRREVALVEEALRGKVFIRPL